MLFYQWQKKKWFQRVETCTSFSHTCTHTSLYGAKILKGKSRAGQSHHLHTHFISIHQHTHSPACKHYRQISRNVQILGSCVGLREKERTKSAAVRTFYLQHEIYCSCPPSTSLSLNKSPALSFYCFFSNLKLRLRPSLWLVLCSTLHLLLHSAVQMCTPRNSKKKKREAASYMFPPPSYSQLDKISNKCLWPLHTRHSRNTTVVLLPASQERK